MNTVEEVHLQVEYDSERSRTNDQSWPGDIYLVATNIKK